MILLDTHVLIWLFEGELDKFPKKLKLKFENEDLFASPLVKLELQYLHEIGRISKTAEAICQALYHDIGLQLHNVPTTLLIEKALHENWTRDPFDRLIVSHARLEKADLVTKDVAIQKNYSRAVWG